VTSQNEAGPDKYFSIEKYITHIPLIAVAVALTFDVGTFYAIGIDFFTLFSLSEHIVFALEALPVAIAVLFFIALLLPGFSRSGSPDTKTSRPPAPKKYRYIAAIVLLVLLGGLLFVAAGFVHDIYESVRANRLEGLLTVFILLCFVPAIGIFFVDPKFKQAHVFVSAVLVCVGVSFSFGLAFGHGFFSIETTSIVRFS
jgi:hypothetical protein